MKEESNPGRAEAADAREPSDYESEGRQFESVRAYQAFPGYSITNQQLTIESFIFGHYIRLSHFKLFLVTFYCPDY